MNKHDIRFLNLAKVQSEKSEATFKLGCIIVKNGKIISRGHNIYKFHREYGSGYHKFLHAEGKAIQEAFKRVDSIRGCVAYVYRKGKNMAKPCHDCMGLLKEYGVKRVVYTCEGYFLEQKV